MKMKTKYETPSKVSREVGVSRTTILDAANRGDIKRKVLPLGTVLVCLTSAQAFAKKQHVPLSNKKVS